MPESYAVCAYCRTRFKKPVGIVPVLLAIFVLLPITFFVALTLLIHIADRITATTDTNSPPTVQGKTYPYGDNADDSYDNDTYGYDNGDYDNDNDDGTGNRPRGGYVLGKDDNGQRIYIYGEFTEDDIQYPSDVRNHIKGNSLAEVLVSNDDERTQRIFGELYANKPEIELTSFYDVYGSDDITACEADIAAAENEFEEMTQLWGAWLDMSDPDYYPWTYKGRYYPDKHYYTVYATDIEYRADSAKVKRELLTSINAVLAKIDTGWSAVDKLRAINDILCAQIEYGESDDDGGQTIYSALIEHKTVCAGYTRAYIVLAKALGINARYVHGTADDGVTSGKHAWLLAQVAGRWYHIDPTWDDSTYSYEPGDVWVRDYFLRSDTYMRDSGHTSWDSGGIVCANDYVGR
ncbi:hypothetical protein FACS1894133_3180 [Clostridia bacterium]|nr:hypothetical protein FACS1894133_3180 [Clostridia bacterium]